MYRFLARIKFINITRQAQRLQFDCAAQARYVTSHKPAAVEEETGAGGVAGQVEMTVQVSITDIRTAQGQGQARSDEQRWFVGAAYHGGHVGRAGYSVHLTRTENAPTGGQLYA